jgi:hypothetical protein
MKNTLITIGLIAALVLLQQCRSDSDPKPVPIVIKDEDKNLAARWADVALHTIQFSFPNSPTFTSRSLGYIGVTMYETVVHGSTSHRSLVGQLNALPTLPLPEENQEYNWNVALNAGQAHILRSLYPHANEILTAKIDSLEQASHEQYGGNNSEVASRSADFGRMIADAIFEWSKTDGGHEGYKQNFDPSYVVPMGNSYWTPPFFGQSTSLLPLHPHWGSNRTFVAENAALPVPEIIPYSKSPTSEYYKLFKAVHDKRERLTAEEKRIAAWWADDPTQTASPPGHSYNLATIAVTTAQSDIFTSAEVYAKVGMSVADAFICCWKAKFTYHSERPTPYITSYIDNNYMPFWPEPPFPAFPSGHATQSASAAIVMMSVYGDNFPLADNTYQGRLPDFEEIPYETRTYQSIWETAEECARSRFLGGIHTKQDNDQGAAQGRLIGRNIEMLSWEK